MHSVKPSGHLEEKNQIVMYMCIQTLFQIQL